MAREKGSTGSEEPKEIASTSRQSKTVLIKKEGFASTSASHSDRKTSTHTSANEDGLPFDSPDLHTRIASRAYELYTHRGEQHGLDMEDWFEAERQVLGKEYQKEAGNTR